MSQENLKIVRRMYESWNRLELQGALAVMHPNIEIRTSGVFPGLEPIYRHHDGVMEFWDSLRSAWQDLIIDAEDVAEVSDGTVVVAVRLKAVGRRSAIKVDLSFGNAWRIEGGLIISYTSFPSYEEAHEAVAGGGKR